MAAQWIKTSDVRAGGRIVAMIDGKMSLVSVTEALGPDGDALPVCGDMDVTWSTRSMPVQASLPLSGYVVLVDSAEARP